MSARSSAWALINESIGPDNNRPVARMIFVRQAFEGAGKLSLNRRCEKGDVRWRAVFLPAAGLAPTPYLPAVIGIGEELLRVSRINTWGFLRPRSLAVVTCLAPCQTRLAMIEVPRAHFRYTGRDALGERV